MDLVKNSTVINIGNTTMVENGLNELMKQIQTNRNRSFDVANNLLSCLQTQMDLIQVLKEENSSIKKSISLTELAMNKVQLELNEECSNKMKRFQQMSNEASKLINKIQIELQPFLNDDLAINNINYLLTSLNDIFSSSNSYYDPITSAKSIDNDNVNDQNNVQQLTSYDTDVHESMSKENEPHKEHQLNYLQNSFRFFKCNKCDISIRPLQYYYQCNLCQIKMDKKCTALSPYCDIRSKTLNYNDNTPNRDNSISMNLKLDQNYLNLMEQCLENIEIKHMEDKNERCYSIKSKHIKVADQLMIQLYTAFVNKNTNGDFLQINRKHNINTLCAFVIRLLKCLDESIIPGHLWNEFSNVCNEENENEKLKLLESLLETKLDQLAKQLLIKLIRHFQILSNKNYSHSLEMNDINRIFGQFIIKLPEEYTSANKKCQEIQNITCQRKILLSLMELTNDKDYWTNVCGSGLTPISLRIKLIEYNQRLSNRKKQSNLMEKFQ